MMTDMNLKLGEVLGDPRIRLIAADAIRKKDIREDEIWNKTLAQLREDHFGGDLRHGFDRLFSAAESGKWYYPLYSGAECRESPPREGTNLVWFPSQDPGAAERPYILLVPGGGFVNVWNLTEGWPVAAQFNDLGYHVFILTYQVEGGPCRLDREMEDFARAISLIRSREKEFGVRWDSYITCGFSAGGYLICLWNVAEKGHTAFGLPGPRASFPVYPWVSLKLDAENADDEDDFDPESDDELFGCTPKEAAESPFEIPDHVRGFPPCAVFAAAEDTLVIPEHSRRLAAALEKYGIPCRLEIGPTGGHGFADATGMCMAGWTERAVRWYESLQRHQE